ncbi:hypothetical protein MW887_009341 [Aspergillus wentii]|nr:hypothetical protein MW887_009341 [Aspergillus wentii]
MSQHYNFHDVQLNTNSASNITTLAEIRHIQPPVGGASVTSFRDPANDSHSPAMKSQISTNGRARTLDKESFYTPIAAHLQSYYARRFQELQPKTVLHILVSWLRLLKPSGAADKKSIIWGRGAGFTLRSFEKMGKEAQINFLSSILHAARDKDSSARTLMKLTQRIPSIRDSETNQKIIQDIFGAREEGWLDHIRQQSRTSLGGIPTTNVEAASIPPFKKDHSIGDLVGETHEVSCSSENTSLTVSSRAQKTYAKGWTKRNSTSNHDIESAQQYTNAFRQIDAESSKSILRALIKYIEPRKSYYFPYNGANPESTKPPWWPDGVVHRKPSDLRKKRMISQPYSFKPKLNQARGRYDAGELRVSP